MVVGFKSFFTEADVADANYTLLSAMRPNDVAQALDLDRIAKDHVWKVEPSCATSGEGKQRIPTVNKKSYIH